MSSLIGATLGEGRAGVRRVDGDGLRLAVLRFAVRALLAAPRFAAPLREAAVLRALFFRDAPAREPAARLVFRAALLLRLADALRLRLAFDFFLPRGGILLLRELGSPGYYRNQGDTVWRPDRIRECARSNDQKVPLETGRSAS